MPKLNIALIALGTSLVFSSSAFADGQSRRHGVVHSRNNSTDELVIGAVAGVALGLAVANKGHRGSRHNYRGPYRGYNRYGYNPGYGGGYNQYGYGNHGSVYGSYGRGYNGRGYNPYNSGYGSYYGGYGNHDRYGSYGGYNPYNQSEYGRNGHYGGRGDDDD